MSSVPFLLAPAYKDYIWGGDRLKKEYGKKTGLRSEKETAYSYRQAQTV